MSTVKRFQRASLARPMRAAFIAALLVCCWSGAAEAQHRARLSADLGTYLASGAGDPVDVIVSGSADRIERVASRHGLRVKKLLSSGAVLSVSPGGLDALANDAEVDALAGDAIVRAHMAVTTATTGAAAAWAGQIGALGAVTGQGIGVAVIDSGIANHPALARRVVASVDFTDPRGTGLDLYGHGTHVAGIIAARGYSSNVDGAASGMAPGAYLINLKVLGGDGSGA